MVITSKADDETGEVKMSTKMVAVASRTTLTVSIHRDGCRHLNTRTDYDIIGRHENLDYLKEIALEVYDPSCVADVKFRMSGCMKK